MSLVNNPIVVSSWGLNCELLSNGRGAIADLVDRFLQFFFRDVQMLGSTLDFVLLVHVDLAAVGLALILQIVHSILSAPIVPTGIPHRNPRALCPFQLRIFGNSPPVGATERIDRTALESGFRRVPVLE
jgi:hypothetical protein